MFASKKLEYRILCHLSRVELDDETARRVRGLLAGSGDRQRLQRLALQQGVGGLVYANLRTLGVSQVGFEGLRAVYTHNVAQMLKTRWELRRLLPAIAARGVAVAVYKGPALVQRLYRHPGLRGFWDVDLLVSPEQAADLRAVLAERGFAASRELPSWFSNGRLELDVHTDPFGFSRNRTRQWAIRAEPQEVWCGAQRSDIAGAPAWRLAPEMEFLVLLSHAVKHSFARIVWLVDLGEYVRQEITEADARRLVEQAGAWGLLSHLAFVASWLKRVLRVPLPHSFAELAGGERTFLERRLAQRLDRGRSTPRVAELLFAQNIPGLTRKAAFLGEALFPKGSVRREIAGSGALGGPLFWPVRLLRALGWGVRFSYQILFG